MEYFRVQCLGKDLNEIVGIAFFGDRMARSTRMTLRQRLSRICVDHPQLVTREIRISDDGSVVRIDGVAKSFYEKQMVQELVRKVEGVASVDNRMQVR